MFVTHSVFEIGLSVAPHRGDDAAARAACSRRLRSTRPIRATKASAPRPEYAGYCRERRRGAGATAMARRRRMSERGRVAATMLCRRWCSRSRVALSGNWPGAAQAIPPYVLPGPGLVLHDAGRRLGAACGSLLVTLDDHLRRLRAGGGRRHRARRAVQPVAAGRILALSVCGDPAGDADRGDRAAAADLSAAAGGGARLRLDRRVLPGAREHHAGPELGRPQSRRPVPALRRLALAGAAASQAAGGAAAYPRRPAHRRRAVADRRGGRGDRGGLGRRRLRPRLPHRRVRAIGSTSRACSPRCCCCRSPAS